MLVMTAKINLRHILLGLAAGVVLIAALILLFGGSGTSAETFASGVSNNDHRVQFLEHLGWEVTTSPVESGQVRIPSNSSEVFERYNRLQKSCGYDLTPYGGKTVLRYVYRVNNYPGATEPVYATLLIWKNQVIGGDITDTSAHGAVRGLQIPEQPDDSTAPDSSEPENS